MCKVYDPEFALKFMERKRKDEFSLRTELTGKDGGAIPITTVHYITPKDPNELIQ